MKRLLTPEEKAYIKEALDFFDRFGPAEVLVADYSGSYPNDPNNAIVMWPKASITYIKEVLDGDIPAPKADRPDLQPETDYYAMLKAFLDNQYDDIYDRLAMVSALEKYSRMLVRGIREDYSKQMKEIDKKIRV